MHSICSAYVLPPSFAPPSFPGLDGHQFVLSLGKELDLESCLMMEVDVDWKQCIIITCHIYFCSRQQEVERGR